MAKLHFRYAAMNAGKSVALLQVGHNYESLGKQILIVKPAVDSKGGDRVISRLGVERPVDFLWVDGESLPAEKARHDVILVDEAQFLSSRQVNELLDVAVRVGITVIAYGLRTDFRGDNFPGAARLLSVAHEIEEIRTLCRCGSKATMNLRKVSGMPVFDGDQVAIDDGSVEYESVCAACHQRERTAAGARWD
ncbi:thymidine kinase [Leucobacter aridicollis]|uniref:Thymidine kinase n=1 Tax=Leucobacter aridicollis TaxID=283878 RepID=A0A852RHH3_9MICO|nr:thymidine kinase [Leucobacter aridicollis]MBL3683647.1 thymidine kinase [Leucobacter aridicollis]NYD28300.1 thymidine kinase [Leucobacter aridicollis]